MAVGGGMVATGAASAVGVGVATGAFVASCAPGACEDEAVIAPLVIAGVLSVATLVTGAYMLETGQRDQDAELCALFCELGTPEQCAVLGDRCLSGFEGDE